MSGINVRLRAEDASMNVDDKSDDAAGIVRPSSRERYTSQQDSEERSTRQFYAVIWMLRVKYRLPSWTCRRYVSLTVAHDSYSQFEFAIWR